MSNINGDRVWFYRIGPTLVYMPFYYGAKRGGEGCFFCECENDHHGCPKNENHIREWLFRLLQAILDHYFLWKNIENWKSYIDCPDTVRWVTVPLFFFVKMVFRCFSLFWEVFGHMLPGTYMYDMLSYGFLTYPRGHLAPGSPFWTSGSRKPVIWSQ